MGYLEIQIRRLARPRLVQRSYGCLRSCSCPPSSIVVCTASRSTVAIFSSGRYISVVCKCSDPCCCATQLGYGDVTVFRSLVMRTIYQVCLGTFRHQRGAKGFASRLLPPPNRSPRWPVGRSGSVNLNLRSGWGCICFPTRTIGLTMTTGSNLSFRTRAHTQDAHVGVPRRASRAVPREPSMLRPG